MKKLLWMIPFLVVAACSTASKTTPKFEQFPGEEMRTATKAMPYSYDAVWGSLREVMEGYRIHTEDKVNGVMLTKWRMNITANTAQLAGRGPAADDYAGSAVGAEQGEFELHNRLSITVIPGGDSTYVTVTNRFWARPYDINNSQSTKFSSRAFSSRNFDNHEEYTVLGKIEEVAAKQGK